MGQHVSELEAQLRTLEERNFHLETMRSYLRTRSLARRVLDAVPEAEAVVLNYPEDLEDEIQDTWQLFSPKDFSLAEFELERRFFDAILTVEATLVEGSSVIAELNASFNSSDWDYYAGNLEVMLPKTSSADTLKLLGWPDVITVTDDEKAHDDYLAEEEIHAKSHRSHRLSMVLGVDVFLPVQTEVLADRFTKLAVENPLGVEIGDDADLAEIERVLAMVDSAISELESSMRVTATLILSTTIRADYPTAVSVIVGRAYPGSGEVWLMAMVDQEGRRRDLKEPFDDAWMFSDCTSYWDGVPHVIELPGQYLSDRKIYSGIGEELIEIRSIPLVEAVIRAEAHRQLAVGT